MRSLLPSLILAAAVAASPLLHAQTTAAASPEVSPSPAKHHRAKKVASPAPDGSPAAATAATSPAKKSHHKKTTEAAPSTSPAVESTGAHANAVASPTPAKRHWFSGLSSSPAASAAPAGPSTTHGSKSGVTAAMTPAPGGGNGQVWVNTKSHVYHKEGSRWYGKTKEGKYMSEQEALKEGDKAAAKED